MSARVPHLPRLWAILVAAVPLGFSHAYTTTSTMAPHASSTAPEWLLRACYLGGQLPVLGALIAYAVLRAARITAPHATEPARWRWAAFYGVFAVCMEAGYFGYDMLLRTAYQIPFDPVGGALWYVGTPSLALAILFWIEGESAFRASAAREQAIIDQDIQRLFASREAMALAHSRRVLETATRHAERLAPRLRAIAAAIRSSPHTADLAGAREGLTALADEYRRLAHRLHPSAVQMGLRTALRSLTAHYGELPLTLQLPQEPTTLAALGACSDEEVLAAYRIAEAALENVARHAGASQVTVSLRPAEDGVLLLEIRDDGIGFDRESQPWGLGFATIESRVALAGWRWILEAEPGRGTRVAVEVQPSAR